MLKIIKTMLNVALGSEYDETAMSTHSTKCHLVVLKVIRGDLSLLSWRVRLSEESKLYNSNNYNNNNM